MKVQTAASIFAGAVLALAGTMATQGDAAATQLGMASCYHYGKRTANGEPFDPNGLTAAHRTLPFGTRVRVVLLKTGKTVIVRINDRGPFIRGRIIDLAHGAAKVLDLHRSGVARVRIDVLR
jgi:rare lipoprotein A